MAFDKFASLAYTDDEKLEQMMPLPMGGRPEYPPYLRIKLTQRELPMIGLGVDCECEKGDVIDLRVFAEVTNVKTEDGAEGFCREIELQIQQVLMFENEMTEEPGDE